MVKLYGYPPCNSCKKAKEWLEEQGETVEFIDMVKEVPLQETLEKWVKESGLPLRHFFNTSGQKYRALGLKDQVDGYTLESACRVLSTDGMLIKRPIVVDEKGHFLTIGFNKNDYKGVFTSWKNNV
ncbi:MAG: Spx/MgsR family RNA polymerase-binding regulatory protein [Tetragenococcus sp.]|nr:Spx/MgsR family RNA polymerase-binding regulatory protein [Tetragenococcus sp.]